MAPKLKFKRIVNAPVEQVYRAFTNSTALREWMCASAQAAPRKGGRLYLWWESGYYTSGEFTALTPNKKVAFTWHGRGEPATTQVQVSLAVKPDGVHVTLTHDGIGTGKAWTGVAQAIRAGWEQSLENLQSTLETGVDLRIARRPLLGLSGSEDLTPERAAQLGVPVKAGLRLLSTIEGMGAQAAGLQKDDVLVRLGNNKIANTQDLAAAMRLHRAGDVVPVVFYRGSEKKTAQLTLSAHPLPELLPTPAAMVEPARQAYAEAGAELAQCFEGIGEEAAGCQPSPDEWSAKQVLAHLILGERGFFQLVDDMVSGEEPWRDGFDNIRPPIDALLALYPTVPELLQELKRAQAETVALLAAVPPEFAARKSTFWRLCSLLPFLSLHIRDHIGQIKAALKAAKRE